MKVMLVFAATAALATIFWSGVAAAAGQPVCVGGPSSALTVPPATGTCPGNERRVELATEGEVTALTSRIKALEDKLSSVRFYRQGVNGLPTLRVAGANLQIVSGSGSTGGPPNGLGNLFLGYDEHGAQEQTGSHNLILGNDQAFTSFGGLLVGQHNTASSPYSAVFRRDNTSSGDFSVVGAAPTFAIRSHAQTASIPSGYSLYDSVHCPAGAQAVGGGFGLTPGVAIPSASYPLGAFSTPTVPEAWKITFWNPTGGTQVVGDSVYAICATP